MGKSLHNPWMGTNVDPSDNGGLQPFRTPQFSTWHVLLACKGGCPKQHPSLFATWRALQASGGVPCPSIGSRPAPSSATNAPFPRHRSDRLRRFPLPMRICRRGRPPSGNAVSVRVSRTLDPGRTRARPRLFDLRPGSTVPVRKGGGKRLTKAWT